MAILAILWSIAYTLIFALSGALAARWLFPDKRPAVRLWLGLAIGLALLIWLPALAAFALGFTLPAQFLALGLCMLLGLLFWYLGRRKTLCRTGWKEDWPLLVCLLPLMLVACALLYTHVILERDGALYVGQSTYGDLSMHLGFITSIAEQGQFPPMYSICPDASVGYPFLSSSLSSTFYLLGCSLRASVILPSIYAFLLVFSGAWFFFEAWLKRKGVAVFATFLFFVGGGFGFAYFFDLLQFSPENLSRLFTAFYETPTNFPSLGLRWVNPIADMLIPQRAILFGWALLFPCLYLLYRAAFHQERSLFIPLGVLAGSLPLIHTHSFLALGVISAFYLFRSLCKNEDKRQLLGYLWYLIAALAVAAPQLILFTFQQSGSFLRFNWNWDNQSDGFLWFYIKNMGLIFLLMPPAFFMNEREDRAVYGGALLLWLLAELIQFQPNAYDNNKLLFIWYMFSCGLVAKFLAGLRERLLGWKAERTARAGARLLSAAVCLALFTSGVLTLVREYISEYQLLGASEVAAARYVKENTEKDATFLTHNNHNNAVAVLTGRNIVCGSGSFLHYHGVSYEEREASLALMYEQPEAYFETLAERYAVDYVFIGPHERGNYRCNESYFAENFAVCYEADGVTIYDISQAPSESGRPA
ncbi:MAG: hypothetical protein Q4C13_02660 [Clostridia bacterium]|nr:hypothetical protein [Clostridia bacterium]